MDATRSCDDCQLGRTHRCTGGTDNNICDKFKPIPYKIVKPPKRPCAKPKPLKKAKKCAGLDCDMKFIPQYGAQKYHSKECADRTRSARDYARLKAKTGKSRKDAAVSNFEDAPGDLALARSFDMRTTLADLSKPKTKLVITRIMESMALEKPPTNQELLTILAAIHLKRIAPAIGAEPKSLSKNVTAAMRELRLTINDIEMYNRGNDKGGDHVTNVQVNIDDTTLTAIRNAEKQAAANNGVPTMGRPAASALSVPNELSSEPGDL